MAAGLDGAALAPFVRRELEGYLNCGLLCRGFARLKCESCAEQHLVAFACKGRGICPSCMGRRMCETAANLVEHVLPAGFDGKLLGVALVPAPRFHTVRYSGVLAAASKAHTRIRCSVLS